MENVVLFKDHSKAQGEIANMNRKLNTMRQHVERLEKETATKDHAIALGAIRAQETKAAGLQQEVVVFYRGARV